jgi:excinuclease ABC subunit C
MTRLAEKIAGFPETPGIYFFKNAAGGIIYIGKARRLRDRVRSYFQPSDDPKVAHILYETADIDYILTDSEREAAFLENNFIQQNQPKFNLRLKDDKSFPYLKATLDEPFPGIYFCRKVGKGKARYFGPFSPANEARKTIHLVSKFFGLRTCEDAVYKNRKRPCLEYDLKLCTAPCVGRIAQNEYGENLSDALLFLEGKTEKLAEILRVRMERAAADEAFEEAAHWRDVLKALEQVRIKPAIISVRLEDQDVFGYAGSAGLHAFHVFVMRKGKVVRSHERVLEADPGRVGDELLREALIAFYAGHDVPPKILVPFLPAGKDAAAAELSGSGGRPPEILVPARGKNRALLDMAGKNAERVLAARDEGFGPLIALKNALGLPALPFRIEGFDVSNTQGEETVASLVSFENGRPWKDGYRKFKIRTVEGPNDVAAMEETLRRHFGRILEEKGALPDLVLVDGGKPQLNTAKRVLDSLGLAGLPLASLAKREEILFTPGRREGIRLERTSAALKLVQHIRDEAHRFAITFHRQRRSKRSFR